MEIKYIDEDTAIFDSCKFRRRKSGRHKDYFICYGKYDKYYRKSLHASVFIYHTGIIPKRNQVIHHIDFDKLNNEIENLQLMTISDHIKLHNDADPNRLKKACREASKRNKELGYTNAKAAVEASRKLGFPGARAAQLKCGMAVKAINIKTNETQEFPSIRSASRHTGVSTTSISDCIKGLYGSVKGFKFEKVGAR